MDSEINSVDINFEGHSGNTLVRFSLIDRSSNNFTNGNKINVEGHSLETAEEAKLQGGGPPPSTMIAMTAPVPC